MRWLYAACRCPLPRQPLQLFQLGFLQLANLLRNIINDRLLPLMTKHGFPVEGCSFDWNDTVEYTPQEQINIEQMLVNGGYDIDPKYFAEKYGIPVIGKREAALPATDLVKQLTAGDPDFFGVALDD